MKLSKALLLPTLLFVLVSVWQDASCGRTRTNNNNNAVAGPTVNNDMNGNSTSNSNQSESRGVTAGNWGGQGVTIEVNDPAATIEFDCAHGAITEKMIINRDGKFAAKGYFVREKGGPIRSDEEEKRLPAIFSGTMADKTLNLTVKLAETNEVIGNFTLTHGKPGRLRKCL